MTNATTAREQTQAIAGALAARLTREQLQGLYDYLDMDWSGPDRGLLRSDAPDGADVILFALSDALA